jgi:hypothetical protein
MLYPILACLQQASLSHVSLSAVSAAFPWYDSTCPVSFQSFLVWFMCISGQDGCACGTYSSKPWIHQVVPVFQCVFHGATVVLCSRPTTAFLMSLPQVLVMIMYQGIELFYAVALMDNPLLSDAHSAVFFFMMLVEYYAVVFVRSKISIRLFPRTVLVQFLALHVYLLGIPYGFYTLGGPPPKFVLWCPLSTVTSDVQHLPVLD